MTRVLGAILAGGRSRRFGSDKAEARLAGRTLLDHAIHQLQPQAEAIVICGRTSAHLALNDRPRPNLGPLGGINAALHYAQGAGFDAVVSVSCDTPLLPKMLVARLCSTKAPCFVTSAPVIGLWPASLADGLDRHLADTSDLSMRHWATVIGAVPVDLGIIRNINTAAELEEMAVCRRG
ncbi:MAG: molybdenum cofactor guanylyltransferase [Bradyrhizobium sp.]|nr:molybdenum cofactor guanylyltransferase [Bradyrhizobium sp.]